MKRKKPSAGRKKKKKGPAVLHYRGGGGNVRRLDGVDAKPKTEAIYVASTERGQIDESFVNRGGNGDERHPNQDKENKAMCGQTNDDKVKQGGVS